MTREAIYMIAVAALVLASAFAVFCVFGDDSSAAGEGPAFGTGIAHLREELTDLGVRKN